MTKHIAVMAGDGIGPEIMSEATKVLDVLIRDGLDVTYKEHPFGGSAHDALGSCLPAETLAACESSDAILLGAIGGPKYDKLPRDERPERALLSCLLYTSPSPRDS